MFEIFTELVKSSNTAKNVNGTCAFRPESLRFNEEGEKTDSTPTYYMFSASEFLKQSEKLWPK